MMWVVPDECEKAVSTLKSLGHTEVADGLVAWSKWQMDRYVTAVTELNVLVEVMRHMRATVLDNTALIKKAVVCATGDLRTADELPNFRQPAREEPPPSRPKVAPATPDNHKAHVASIEEIRAAIDCEMPNVDHSVQARIRNLERRVAVLEGHPDPGVLCRGKRKNYDVYLQCNNGEAYEVGRRGSFGFGAGTCSVCNGTGRVYPALSEDHPQ